MSQIKANSHLYVRWIFIRILCFCFFAAFLSIAFQIVGLYGQHGILPLSEVLAQFTSPETKLLAMLTNPSLFWFNSSDNFMRLVCFSGAGISVLAFCGFLTGPLIAVMWFLYLSIVSLGQEFMGFQWDSLLLETSLLAIWFAPWNIREIHPWKKKEFESQAEPSYIFLFLLRILCFKLMIFSGICKLASQDAAWSDLSAMAYHYETQPLPTPLAWLTQKLPLLLQQFSTLAVFVIELVLPAGLLLPWRQGRIAAACSFIFLQLLIILTGNYAFFNWLTIALSLTLLNDQYLFSILPKSLRKNFKQRKSPAKAIFRNTLFSLLIGVFISYASLSQIYVMSQRYSGSGKIPVLVQLPIVLMQPSHSLNSYGLFAIMTTSRPEIIIEGSNDGVTWLPYEFKYKPGDIKRPPPIVAPHQPRLDWQMWFASLGPLSQSPWFDLLVKAMLEGSPDVLALFQKNPFPDKAPKYIRAETYDYHFSTFEALLKRGEWWTREHTGTFYPPSTLQDLSY